MTGLLRSELRKLLTTQTWFWLLLTAAGLAAVIVILPITAGAANGPGALHDIVTNGNLAFVAVFLLGVLSVTTEYRYQTITPTLLATPSRLRIVTAKLVTFFGAGLVFAVVIAIVQIAIAVPWLSARGVPITALGRNGALTAVAEVALVVVLYALIGVGFGALLRNQIVAVVVGLVYVLLIENLLVVFPGVRRVYPYLPGGAASAIYQWGRDHTLNGVVDLVPSGVGVVLLVAWALLLAGTGVATSLRRDIT